MKDSTIATIHRFELMPNSAALAQSLAFNFYGLFLLPFLLGGMILYNVFLLRDENFLLLLCLLLLVLINTYIFNKKKITRSNSVQLILTDSFLELLNDRGFYLQQTLQELEISWLPDRNPPALRIVGQDFPCLLISPPGSLHQLPPGPRIEQPTDYCLVCKGDWPLLIQLTQV
ncbi:MAG: hypothetical protein AAFZ63_19670 [Bacteroidota bacterium]